MERVEVAHSFRLAALGTFIGVGATFALGRVVRASGEGGSFLNPEWSAFLVPAAIILAIAGLATWGASRRALRIDSAVLLRTQ